MINGFQIYLQENSTNFVEDNSQLEWKDIKQKMREKYDQLDQFSKEQLNEKAEIYNKSLNAIIEKPKKPLSPFFIFTKQNRDQIQQANPNLSMAKVTMKLCEIYKNLPEDQLNYYYQQAQILKIKYQEELKRYTQQNQEKDDF